MRGFLLALLPLAVWAAPEKSGDGSEVADYKAHEAELAKRPAQAVIAVDKIARLGYELPDKTIVGRGGRPELRVKGVSAQCAIGNPKRFELCADGLLDLGSAGLRFDSNYARGETNDVVFAGGEISSFESSSLRSAAPIVLTGTVRLTTRHKFLVRASLEGPGELVKRGSGTLGFQYPCDRATGRLVIEAGAVVFGSAASWQGTVVVKRGASLTCTSKDIFGKVEQEKGAVVVETGLGTRGNLSSTVFPQPATAYDLTRLRRERMGRGVFAFRVSDDEVRVSWRYKSSDPTNVAFHVYRDNVRLTKTPIADVTWYGDKFKWDGKAHVYEVISVGSTANRQPPTTNHQSPSSIWRLPASSSIGYFDLELNPPKSSRTPDGQDYTYQPYDCSVGDLDGDGEYELLVIWWPTRAYDNSQSGQTGETWLEGVKLDGSNRSLWKICLGPNIRSGAHYVPVMVADFDGDGSAEIICRTADGTMDGKGRILNEGVFNARNTFKDWREEDAHVVFAPNYVTCFSGKTGIALDTIPYKPSVHEDPNVIARKDAIAVRKFWNARNPGNQAFRFLAAVGYLDGVHPSALMCRGYYSRTCITALDFDGRKLTERWYFCSDDEENWGYGGQGFHNLRVGDVDFDGKDELVYGHMCIDHDGKGLWTTGYGHGDALHLIQASPETRGLQVWTCHEASPYGVSLIDAQTGRTIFHKKGPQDTGSCNALDIDPRAPGVELFSGTHCGIFSAKTHAEYLRPKPNPSVNYYGTLRFGIWWMGDLTRSAYSGGDIIRGYSTKGRSVWDQWNGGGATESNHGTKGTPCLIADLFGDWREEILLRRKDNKAIRIYMTPEETPYRFHTLMEDPVYRASVTTQNCGYNVPTQPGFYFGPDLLGHGIWFRGTFLK